MDTKTREKWQARYGAASYAADTEAEPFLRQRVAGWKKGQALCLAAGAGRNAVFLAECGFSVTAVDISERGLSHCRRLAAARGVEVDAVEADLLEWDMGAECYDLIVSFYYFEKRLFAPIKRALKPGGLFVLQTFSTDQAELPTGPNNPAFLVAPNSLLSDWADLRVRHYEDGQADGEAFIRLIAEKTAISDRE